MKILESFAHRVPVVSTTIGVEGFDLIDGVHLFVADDPDAFAAACHRLLTEPTLRKDHGGCRRAVVLGEAPGIGKS